MGWLIGSIIAIQHVSQPASNHRIKLDKMSTTSIKKLETNALKSSKQKIAEKKKEVTKPSQRIDTHRTDTEAFRKLLNHLHVDWVVRSMEERDYGIDLQLEIFDSCNPTGSLIFGQLKGTKNSFSEEDGFQFQVKTLLYAELFSTPFFLFRTSTSDNKTRFIWLQKYIETKLPVDSPEWRTQETVKVSMPEDNDLKVNKTRFLRLAMDPVRQRQALEFLRVEHNLTLHTEGVLTGQYRQGIFCSAEAKKLTQLKTFIVGSDWQGEDDYATLCKLYEHFNDIAANNSVSAENKKYVKECLDIIDNIKIEYLTEPDIHSFVSAEGGVIYY